MLSDRPDIAWCVIDGVAVGLDIAADRYFRLDEVQNAQFLANASPEWLDRPHQPVSFPLPDNWERPQTRSAAIDDGSFRLGDVARSLWMQRRIERRLATRSFAQVLGDPSGDERVFVEALADHLGVAMDAAIYEPASVDLTQSASAGLPSPSRRTLALAIDAELDTARCELGANAIFDGNGGDSLFCFLHSAAPVVDRLRTEGLRSAIPTLLDMCAVTGADVPTMVAAVWRRYWRRDRPDRWTADLALLADASDPCRLPPALTPWLDCEVGSHLGKHDHLAMIMHAQNHVHGLRTKGVPRFSPLMSQPLVELCLSLPTWLWCRGGINRSLARAAFADALPQAVLRRTSKAGPDSFLRRLFDQNREQIRTMLLDGHLARNALLDRPAVEAAMATDTLSSDAVAYRLLDLCEAEAWARSWIG